MPVKRNVVLMCGISLLQGMVFYGPIATLYRQAAGVRVFQITLVESISLALSVLLELPWGLLADRIGYRRTMLFCCGLYFLSKLVFWRADGFGMFLLERVMLSVVVAGLSGVDVSMLYLSSGQDDAQRVFGVYNSLGTAGLMIAACVYSLWIGNDYRLAGLLTVVSYGAAAALAFGLREVRPEEKRGKRAPGAFSALLGQTAKNRPLLLLLLGTALFNEAHQTITVFLNQLQYARCGMSSRAIGLISILVMLGGMCGGLSARLTKGLGSRRLGTLLLAGGAAACTALAATQSAALSVMAVLLLRVCFSLFQPLQTDLQNRQVTTADRATALSINAVLMESVAVSTNLLYGSAAERSLPLALAAGAVSCAAGAGLFLYSTRRTGA